MTQFLSGCLFMSFFLSGLFFLRFRVRTQDAFFSYFTAAFWLLALERIPLLLITAADERHGFIFLIRLTAFLLIIYAIIDKNRQPRR